MAMLRSLPILENQTWKLCAAEKISFDPHAHLSGSFAYDGIAKIMVHHHCPSDFCQIFGSITAVNHQNDQPKQALESMANSGKISTESPLKNGYMYPKTSPRKTITTNLKIYHWVEETKKLSVSVTEVNLSTTGPQRPKQRMQQLS